MAYTLGELRTEGICLTKIHGIDFSHSYGEHAVLTISGLMEYETCKEQIYEIQEDTIFSLFAEKEGVREPLFHGLVSQAEVEGNGGLYSLVITAKSFSCCMDVVKKSRTFQDTAMTYHQLVRRIIGEYPGADCMLCFKDQLIGAIAVQYHETDWEFLKRMLSLIYQPLSCAVEGENLQLYAGIPELESREEKFSATEYAKDMGQFYFWKEMGADIQEIDMFYCKAETDALISLFQKTVLLEQPLLVSGVYMKGEKGTLRSYLRLQKKEGVLVKPIYPMHLIGIALEGTVTDVAGRSLKVQLDIDRGDALSAVYWFPYSSLSASPDGSGWYCMPEKGDRVRVNFPTRDTKDVIAISSVSSYSGKGETDRMGNPGTRYLRTQNGQEMSLSGGVSLKNGPSRLEIGTGGGVNLSTSNAITITATDKITLNVTGPLSMHSKTQGAYICKEGNLTLSDGGNLQIQGKDLVIG